MGKDSSGARWVHAICSVVFDIDEGQKLEQCFPENALTDEEANDVAFHSFPVHFPEAHRSSHSRFMYLRELSPCPWSTIAPRIAM